MIKLIAIESKERYRLLLRFSDGAWGICDFAPFVDANTAMTAPLCEPSFFAKHLIEAGALAWPNGFDLAAGSLHQRLREAGALQYTVATP